MAAMMWDGKERLARANGRDAADEREKSEGREAEEERGKRSPGWTTGEVDRKRKDE